ncbi:hypothetical protein PIIN_10831, partial [Serendipita indica DSM 11827]
MLTNETNLHSPEVVYNRLISLESAGVIDNVYSLVFERIEPEYQGAMCEMLALLLAAFEPLTVDDLDDILKQAKLHGSAKALVRNLGSVLSTDKTTNLIQFRHPTLVEYLQRCSIHSGADNRNKISINVANAHSQASSWCLAHLMSRTDGLKFNICRLESSFYLNKQIPDLDIRISKYIPRRLRYASSHWLFHVSGM